MKRMLSLTVNLSNFGFGAEGRMWLSLDLNLKGLEYILL